MEHVNNLNWRKSTYSSNGGECVEAATHDGLVLVRDTKANDPVHRCTTAQWRAFVTAIRNGGFNPLS
jgi:hypothetical protein